MSASVRSEPNAPPIPIAMSKALQKACKYKIDSRQEWRFFKLPVGLDSTQSDAMEAGVQEIENELGVKVG